MKVEELRLGNTVEVFSYRDIDGNDIWLLIDAIDIDQLKAIHNRPPAYQPVKLTPSWLKRMEYGEHSESTKEIPLWVKGNLYIEYSIDDESLDKNKHYRIYMYNYDDQPFPIIVDFVHQLQNAEFILTGKEIEIKQLEEV